MKAPLTASTKRSSAGIGEKRVALDWESVKLTRQDDDRTFEVKATREELEQMPEYRQYWHDRYRTIQAEERRR